LTAYAARLADANGVTRSRVLLPWRHDIDVPRSEVAAVAALGDLDADATARLTMNRYPLAIRGHGQHRRHGWRLHHSVQWICLSCTPGTGHLDLLWQTALMPVCLRCSSILTRTTTPTIPMPAHPRILELARILADLAEASIEESRPRDVLYRLRRRCQHLAATVDQDSVDGLRMPRVDVASARQWGAYPSPDPGTVAALLVLAGKGLVSKRPRKPAHLRCHQTAAFSDADRDRLAWFLTRVRHHVVRDGLRPAHVPSMLPMPADAEPRRPGQWLSLARAAVALHVLISQARDETFTSTQARDALGVNGIPGCLLIDGVAAGHGLRQQDAALLAGALDQLLADGLIDYQRRRDTLRPITRLPRAVRHRLPAANPHGPTPSMLALGWIWTRLTRGPMYSSPTREIPDRDIHAFDARLDPELRLVLYETGQQFLADADLITIPSTQTTATATTWRYV